MPGSLVPAKNGGRLRYGSTPGNTPGTGRPRDETRRRLLQIAGGDGIDFLADLMKGELRVKWVGMCPHCHKESVPDEKQLEKLDEMVGTSVDHRIRANEQALKYGLGTQTEVMSPDRVKEISAKLVEAFHAAVSAEVPDDVGARIAARFKALWKEQE